MLDLDEALARVLARAIPLPTEVVALPDARGRVLAEDLAAPDDLPRFDYSAMDGYAVSLRDFAGPGPWMLPVVGESRAGHAVPEVVPGTACRIFTGAPLPVGAEAVVIQEEVEPAPGAVRFSRAPRLGDHVRRRGEDMRAGEVVLARGRRLGPFELGLAAALDRAALTVGGRPTISILCTGDELRPPGSPGGASSLPESNSVAIAALAATCGASVASIALVGDDLASLPEHLKRCAAESDVVLTIGGASVGEHDLVRPALAAAGAAIDFWKVKIKPGKPVLFGNLGRALVLGLPGNPVSAQVTFFLLGMPLLRALQGDASPAPRPEQARLAEAIQQKPGRLGLYRARLEAGAAHVLGGQASGSVVSLALADALVLVPADRAGYAAGETVSILRLPRA